MAAPPVPPPSAGKYLHMNDRLFLYMVANGVRPHPVLEKLRAYTKDQFPNDRGMQISQEEGAFLSMLTRISNAKKCVEVGVFTGYSSTCVALALPADGRLVALDVSVEWTNVANQHWVEAGVDKKIDLRIAPAIESLDKMLATPGEEGTYDFAFIDADKPNYKHYYERILKLLRPGGLIAIDNVLWDGRVAAATIDPTDEKTQALFDLNKFILADQRVEISMVPVSDGVTLCWKKLAQP